MFFIYFSTRYTNPVLKKAIFWFYLPHVTKNWNLHVFCKFLTSLFLAILSWLRWSDTNLRYGIIFLIERYMNLYNFLLPTVLYWKYLKKVKFSKNRCYSLISGGSPAAIGQINGRRGILTPSITFKHYF